MSRLRWRGKLPFGFMLLLTQMMPGAVIVVPVFKFFREENLTGHLWAVALLHAAFILPIGVWILMRLFSALPEDVLDAARVDGSGDIGVLWRIVMPLSMPGLVAVGVVAFFFSWNEYLFTSTLITDGLDTRFRRHRDADLPARQPRAAAARGRHPVLDPARAVLRLPCSG